MWEFCVNLADPSRGQWRMVTQTTRVVRYGHVRDYVRDNVSQPVLRGYHAAGVIGDRLFIFGGFQYHPRSYFQDVWCLPLPKNRHPSMRLLLLYQQRIGTRWTHDGERAAATRVRGGR